ncbi:hypothetical protein D3C80_1532330 [compost metagenome]
MVRHLVLRIILRPFRQIFRNLLQQRIDVAAQLGGNRNDLGKRVQLVVFRNQRKQRFRLDFVNLVHYQNYRCLDLFQLLRDEPVAAAHPFRSIYQEQHGFHFMQCA